MAAPSLLFLFCGSLCGSLPPWSPAPRFRVSLPRASVSLLLVCPRCAVPLAAVRDACVVQLAWLSWPYLALCLRVPARSCRACRAVPGDPAAVGLVVLLSVAGGCLLVVAAVLGLFLVGPLVVGVLLLFCSPPSGRFLPSAPGC